MVPSDERRVETEPEGFVSLATLRAKARACHRPSDFIGACAGPALLVLEDLGAAATPSGTPPAGPTPSSSSHFQLVTLEGGSGATSAAVKRYHGRVGFIAKRPGNPFPNMISIGRSTSNDVVFALDTISKLHGYFLRESDGWFYSDYQSTNGTAINSRKVEKGEKRRLFDGDRLQIGLDLTAQFLSPETLYDHVRGGGA
jgi:hypothetical protein